MGLSEEERKKHPYLVHKRFEDASGTPEYVKANKVFESALIDMLYEALRANFKARKEEPTTFRVIEGTFQLTDNLVKKVWSQWLPSLTEKMLEKFDLVKEKEMK